MGARFDGNLRKRDLETDTPYNTYTRDGLPPTPIALPSQASLDAVSIRRPTRTSTSSRAATAQSNSRPTSPITTAPWQNSSVARAERRATNARAIDTIPTPRPLHHARRHRRRRQEHARRLGSPSAIAARRARASWRRASPAARRWARRCASCCCTSRCTHDTEALLMFAARREHVEQRDPARARARRLGAVRPLHRRDLRLPGRRPRRRPRAHRRARAVGARRLPARPHDPVRRADRGVARAPRSRAERRARPSTSSSARRVRSSSACARLTSSGPPRSRARFRVVDSTRPQARRCARELARLLDGAA